MGVIIPNAVNAVSTVSAILVILLLCCYCPCNLSGTEFWEAIEIKMDGALDSGSLWNKINIDLDWEIGTTLSSFRHINFVWCIFFDLGRH